MFAVCALLGFQFAPRIPDLKSRRLYIFGKPSSYPMLEPLIGGRIHNLIERRWGLLTKATLWNVSSPSFAAFKPASTGFLDTLPTR